MHGPIHQWPGLIDKMPALQVPSSQVPPPEMPPSQMPPPEMPPPEMPPYISTQQSATSTVVVQQPYPVTVVVRLRDHLFADWLLFVTGSCWYGWVP